MQSTEFNTWPVIKERGHYALWLIFSVVSVAISCLAFNLVVCALLGGRVPLSLSGGFSLSALLLLPTAIGWRKHGEAHYRFLEVEHGVDVYIRATGTKDYARYKELERLIAAIDDAHGMDRQAARGVAKAWIEQNEANFSEAERELVLDRLGYLRRRK